MNEEITFTPSQSQLYIISSLDTGVFQYLSYYSTPQNTAGRYELTVLFHHICLVYYFKKGKRKQILKDPTH